ncbi:MAG: Hcp1 family type VI secretion system effector [Anaeromyxobacter sp. RBG_16_69_14]|nr:MAG: Hcp1 family type VI secretion system effector [Anaeromyxobacter sp. RBG_16_69_14]
MAVDMFLKVDSIKGDSVDDKHKGEIDVLSWSWGVTQSGTTHSGSGGGAGKANVHDVTITKFLDRSTPILLKHCLSGIHIKEAALTVRKAGGKPLEYVKIKMTEAIVSSINTGGSGSDDRLTETLGLNFANVEFEYVPQKPDGSGDAAIPITWNIAKNAEK